MESKTDFQAEDSPTIETPPPASDAAHLPQPVSKPGFLRKTIRWTLVAIIFFLIGAELVFFTVYRSATNALNAAMANSSQLSEQLSTSEVDLQKAKKDLSTAQGSLVDANNALIRAQEFSLLYKFQADVNGARAALLNLDPSSARQNLSIATSDLTDLSKTGISADTLSGLQPQLDLALTNLESDPQKAMSALDTLYTNLLLISGNIK